LDHPFIGVSQTCPTAAGLNPEPTRFGAHSDIGLPTGLGQTPIVNFGLGDTSAARQVNEEVAIDSLLGCTMPIALAVASWCGRRAISPSWTSGVMVGLQTATGPGVSHTHRLLPDAPEQAVAVTAKSYTIIRYWPFGT
jgi:hypothetical protein